MEAQLLGAIVEGEGDLGVAEFALEADEGLEELSEGLSEGSEEREGDGTEGEGEGEGRGGADEVLVPIGEGCGTADLEGDETLDMGGVGGAKGEGVETRPVPGTKIGASGRSAPGRGGGGGEGEGLGAWVPMGGINTLG